jgi:hypothetical protein
VAQEVGGALAAADDVAATAAAAAAAAELEAEAAERAAAEAEAEEAQAAAAAAERLAAVAGWGTLVAGPSGVDRVAVKEEAERVAAAVAHGLDAVPTVSVTADPDRRREEVAMKVSAADHAGADVSALLDWTAGEGRSVAPSSILIHSPKPSFPEQFPVHKTKAAQRFRLI